MIPVLEYEGIVRTLERERDEARTIARRLRLQVRHHPRCNRLYCDDSCMIREFDALSWAKES